MSRGWSDQQKETWIKIGDKGHDIVEEGLSLGYLWSYPKMIIGQGYFLFYYN